ncbi:MAG: hypothetical protein NTY09_06250 [bacterium]|nr:hypothetical protein [bacterium]
MKQISLFISLIIIGAGLYLKFIYDVPDNQETINFFVSWFMIIIGISSLLVNLLWSSKPVRKHDDQE